MRNTHANYESPISKDKKDMANNKVFQKKVKGHVTIDLLTQKSIGVFLSLSSIWVWNMKLVGWEILSYRITTKCVQTDGRTDGQTDRRTDGRTDRQSDYYRAPASSMAGP